MIRAIARANHPWIWIVSTLQCNIEHLYNMYTTSAQRRRRWADVVYMLYKCFVCTGYGKGFAVRHGDRSLSAYRGLVSVVYYDSSTDICLNDDTCLEMAKAPGGYNMNKSTSHGQPHQNGSQPYYQ